MTAQRVTFRPPVSLGVARDTIAAALADEGLAFATRTSGQRPAVWAARVIDDDGPRLDVYLDPSAIVALVPELEPRCDLCGRSDGPGPADWNGETGNHRSCEEDAR